MPYLTIQEFYKDASTYICLSRQEEIQCAINMKNGDRHAKERLVQSYLPIIAGHLKKQPENLQTLGMALYCQQELEKAIDCFDFLQDNEPFMHRISWILREAMCKYIGR